jgi:hypothetical protein
LETSSFGEFSVLVVQTNNVTMLIGAERAGVFSAVCNFIFEK